MATSTAKAATTTRNSPSQAAAVKNNPALSEWIAHVFDHPVAEPAWHWALDAPPWPGAPAELGTLIAETFERAGDRLARFTDGQLAQGFRYLASSSCSDFMFSLVEPEAPREVRLRAFRSFVPLFQQIMAARCSPHLSHLDERPANPLNGVCYMWWDILPIYGFPENPDRAEFDSEVLSVLRQLLAIPHDACRESALHGISEWSGCYPAAGDIVDEFLAGTPNLRPELIRYAIQARHGNVQ